MLSIKNAKVNGNTYGGYAKKNAKYNKVIITGGDFGGSNYKIYGGYSETNGDASENIVNIEGGSRQELIDIYGGSSDSGKAINNTVNLSVDNLTLGRLYGGYVQNGNADKFSGNTLTLNGKNITANNMENFERLNFYIPVGFVPNTDKMCLL